MKLMKPFVDIWLPPATQDDRPSLPGRKALAWIHKIA
jgi:hypothetical protein